MDWMNVILWLVGTLIVVLGPIILIHELGHFVTAKLAGARVEEFGFGSLDLKADDFVSPDRVVQLGYPPVRIDLITVLDGLTSEEIWESREKGKFGNNDVLYLGREAFIKNKRVLGRHKDLADLELLGEKV